MKVFVTGHNGFLGKKIVKVLKEKHEIITSNDLDIESKENVKKNLTDCEIVIHCAGQANVDWCEQNKLETWKTNVAGTINVVEKCKELNAKLVYVSTDYCVNPTNFYAYTKLVGEEQALKLPDSLSVRISTLYGFNDENDKKTFVNWVLSSKDEIKTVTDNITHPTLIDDIALNIERQMKKRKGIINVVGKDCISKFEFTNKIIQVFGLSLKNSGIESKELKHWVAIRPEKIQLEISEEIKTHDTIEGLEIMRKQMKESD
ncbi:MAG: sugar nucleotide-binding protein [archaeon]